MDRAVIEKIVELAGPSIREVGGSMYSNQRLTRIHKELRAEALCMTTLSSLVDYIKGANEQKGGKGIVQVVSPTEVRFVSMLDNDRSRETLVIVEAEIPIFRFGVDLGNEEFIVGVQAKFVDDEDTDKGLILKFSGSVRTGSIKEYGDDGVTQTATIKLGAASLSTAIVPNPCTLRPYRTFTEVEQPISRFIFRMKDNERAGVTCALHEADGGAWKCEAMRNIKEYFTEQLSGMEGILVIS